VLRTERIAHLGTEETAALRDFNAAYDRSGSKTGCPRNVLGESAKSRREQSQQRALFDHLVGEGEQRHRISLSLSPGYEFNLPFERPGVGSDAGPRR
jgi:hypothetical protein